MTEEVNDLIAHRLRKLKKIRDAGDDPYKSSFARTKTAAVLETEHGGLKAGAYTGETVSVAGRLLALRRHGKASFAEMRDLTGGIQLYLAEDLLGKTAYEDFLNLDIGDIIGATG